MCLIPTPCLTATIAVSVLHEILHESEDRAPGDVGVNFL